MAKIALLIADDAEQSGALALAARFEAAAHVLTAIGAGGEQAQEGCAAVRLPAPAVATELYPDDFDALVIPDGTGIERLRLNRDIVTFVQGFMATHAPVGAIGHGPQLLIEAEAVQGRALTSSRAIHKDVENAGGMWIDQAVVEDDNLVTAQGPGALDAFCSVFLARLEQQPPAALPSQPKLSL